MYQHHKAKSLQTQQTDWSEGTRKWKVENISDFKPIHRNTQSVKVYVADKAKITLSQTTTPPPPSPITPAKEHPLSLFFTNLTLQCCTCRLEKEVIERDRGWREAYIRQYPTQWSLILVSALGVGGKCFTCVKSWGRLGYLTGLVGAVHFFSFGRTGVMETVPCSMWISSSLGGLVFGL